ncbi:hypothetical protein HPP92_011900 [Vanilla planifolia]|uniref:X8 domain-containing protein n=1 Tax=Vanilla planifolia TaxID=51239 RepID=A0A835R0L6_VANPL|nr:hypothetical protein HPP92_012251 [Vanilla planifolia]KAG0483816.1 hypothetical protein HPP92_011900 [Vanilla planifolia]
MTSLATRAWFPLAFFLAMAAGGSDASWCVCRQELSDAALQKTLDYACGAGADCVPINQNGACYNPNTVKAHCSYAVNSYYQRRGQAQQACDFAGTASVTQQDPGANGCTYPASSSAAGSSSGGNNGFNTGFGTGTGTGMGTGATPTPTTTANNPGSANPSSTTPTGAGIIGPSGNTFSPNSNSRLCTSMPHMPFLILHIIYIM